MSYDPAFQQDAFQRNAFNGALIGAQTYVESETFYSSATLNFLQPVSADIYNDADAFFASTTRLFIQPIEAATHDEPDTIYSASLRRYVLPPPPDRYGGDRHVRRGQEDYAVALMRLLPTGLAWPRDVESVLSSFMTGLAGIWGSIVQSRAGDLLEYESDPQLTYEMLQDWERNWGLPDLCLDEPITLADRRAALLIRMTELGGASRAYFFALAARIGYTINRIREFSPFVVGISRVGEVVDEWNEPRWQLGPGEIRFVWVVFVGETRLQWFRVGQDGGRCGIDPFCRIARATDLECLFRRNKPGHTYVVFNYSQLPPITYVDLETFHHSVIMQT